MNKVLLASCLLALSLSCHSQGVTLRGREARAKWEEVQADPGCLHALGSGSTESEAVDRAKAVLGGLVSTTIRSDFEYRVSQESRGSEVQAEERMSSIVRSYSSSTLGNLNMLVLGEAPKSRVAVYIPRSDLQAMYEARRQRALVCIDEAAAAKAAGRLDEMFDRLSVAEMLVATCSGPVELRIISQTRDAGDYIAEERRSVARDITVEETALRTDGESDVITVLFRYRGEPAGRLAYTYEVDGRRSEVCVTNDGLGEVIVPRGFRKRLTASPNFSVSVGHFSGDINRIDPADRGVARTSAGCRVAAYREDRALAARAAPQDAGEAATGLADSVAGRFPVRALTAEEAAPYLETMRRMEVILRSGRYAEAARLCTPEGFDMLNRLIAYGSARLLKDPVVQFLRCGDDITCRSFPMTFSFRSTGRRFTENVVFHLNPEGRVTEVAFALETAAADDILNRKSGRYYSDEVKQTIVNFLERYKTAFALKRRDYIESIFSGDALIIVGSVLKRAEGYTDMCRMTLGEDEVRYTQLGKDEYMRNLERCFDSNEYINIRFSESTVARGKPFRGRDRFYGIQIRQDYFSQTYGDTGYLFLLLDMEDPQRPVINARVWQPQRDGRFVSDGRCSLNDFTWE